MQTSNRKEKIILRVDLKGESLTRFYALKDLFGLKNDTELIRLLISQEYHRQFKNVE
jgi:hypothetical protein